MVLEKFGSGLKNTFRKITRMGVVDEKAVEAVIRDLQRTLIQSDVDVNMVFGISKSLKEKVLREKPPKGMTLKEYFLKSLYDEMINLLGREKGKLDLKKQRILMIGLFGSGKCVHPKSNIILDDGNVMTAEEIYEEYKKIGEDHVEDGKIINITDQNLLVPSFNPKTLKVESKKVTHLWKLEGKRLLNVSLDNGNDFSIKVTPEHPFFAMRRGELKQIRADELEGDDYVAVPRCHKHKGKLIDLYDDLKNIDLWIYDNPETLKKNILSRHSTLKKANACLKFKRNYCKFTGLLKRGIAPIELSEKTPGNMFKIKARHGQKHILFPRYLTGELAEFLGYLTGDGHLNKRYVEITNEDTEIISRIEELSHCLFGLKPDIKMDKRTKKMYSIRIVSTTLVELIGQIFGLQTGKKGKQLKIPRHILISGEESTRRFIKAYFDCDASLSKWTRGIEITSESRILLSQVSSLLLRFGIIATISKKLINNIPYWRLAIRSRYAETYAEKIGFRINRKRTISDQYKKIGIRQGCGKHDMIPLSKTLRELRQSLGFSIGYLQEMGVNSYGRYENFGMISRESLEKVVSLYETTKEGKMLHILQNIGNKEELSKYSFRAINAVISHFTNEGMISKGTLTTKGAQFIDQMNRYPVYSVLNYLINLAKSDVCWIKVNNIKLLDNQEKYVYDFTVEDNHSFIADNIIVHNTTTSGKLSKWLKTRGLSSAMVACDTHRPAAQDQLRQIGKQINVPVYDKGKKPEDIAKDALKRAKEDVLIFDSAGRDALDGQLAKELKNMGKTIKPDEVLLVLPADIGQAARKQAEEFNKLVGITGLVITKLDGTAKGGGALAASSVSGSTIKLIGTGEKIEDLEEYDPKRFVGRLIGHGDIQGLLDKAREAGAEKAAKNIMEGKFTLNEFHDQIESLQKMGSLNKVMDMIPGLSAGGLKKKLPDNFMDVQEDKMKKWKFVIGSMTPDERENPDKINPSRISRIARGSGTKPEDVRSLLKQYKQIKKVLKMTKGGKSLKRGPLAKLAKQFGMGMG